METENFKFLEQIKFSDNEAFIIGVLIALYIIYKRYDFFFDPQDDDNDYY